MQTSNSVKNFINTTITYRTFIEKKKKKKRKKECDKNPYRDHTADKIRPHLQDQKQKHSKQTIPKTNSNSNSNSN